MKLKYIAGIALMLTALLASSCSKTGYDINTTPVLKTVETGDAAVTATSATISGVVTDLSGLSGNSYEVGVYYSSNENTVTSGKKKTGAVDPDGKVSALISELTTGNTYYYCIYVTLQKKVTTFGTVKSFVTTDAAIATAQAADIAIDGATFGGTLNGVSDKIESESSELTYGIELMAYASEGSEPITRMYPAHTSSNTFSVVIGNLLPSTNYSYRAYMALNGAYEYGETLTITTATQATEYVDLGLSVVWAASNVGAATESHIGTIAGYGDVTALNTSPNAYDYIEADIVGTPNDLALLADPNAKMPTFDQIKELIAGTTVSADEVGGVPGYRFTSKINGNSIFFPTVEGSAAYWTGSINTADKSYATTLSVIDGEGAYSASSVATPLPVRGVKVKTDVTIDVDNSKVKLLNKDDQGNDLRIEIYNEYGPTSGNPAINLDQLVFEKNMMVEFTLSGINLKEGAVGKYKAAIQASAAGWYPGYWGSGVAKYDCEVTGDGTYRVWCDTPGTWISAVVFCIDIQGIYADLADPSTAQVVIDKIKLDFDDRKVMKTVPVNSDKVLFNNKDGNGTDGRIELYNEYGDTKADPCINLSDISFQGRMNITFTISGIDGNTVDGAALDYMADISYATPNWWPSYWGGGIGTAQITQDGTYTVYCNLNDGWCDSAVVFCVETYGLWKDLVDPSLIKITIDELALQQDY